MPDKAHLQPVGLEFGMHNGAAASLAPTPSAASMRRAIGDCGSRIRRKRKSNGISPPASAASSNVRVRLLRAVQRISRPFDASTAAA